MEVSRRQLMTISAAAAICAIAPAPTAMGSPVAPRIPFETLFENEGCGEFGYAVGAYAKGHYTPLTFAREIVSGMGGDDFIKILSPELHPDLYDENEELKDEGAAAALLAPRVRNGYATIEYLDGEDGSWIFHRVDATTLGAFAATYFDQYS